MSRSSSGAGGGETTLKLSPVRWGATARELVRQCVDQLSGHRKIAGVAFNQVDDRQVDLDEVAEVEAIERHVDLVLDPHRAVLAIDHEHLEAELQQFYAAAAQDSAPRGRFLH